MKHILGAAAHAMLAAEQATGEPAGDAARNWALEHAPAQVVAVLHRFPAAPAGGGRVGAVIRDIDAALRSGGSLTR